MGRKLTLYQVLCQYKKQLICILIIVCRNYFRDVCVNIFILMAFITRWPTQLNCFTVLPCTNARIPTEIRLRYHHVGKSTKIDTFNKINWTKCCNGDAEAIYWKKNNPRTMQLNLKYSSYSSSTTDIAAKCNSCFESNDNKSTLPMKKDCFY